MNLPHWIEENVALAPMTTFAIGGPARWLAVPATRAELIETLTLAGSLGVRIKILGGGSNLLVADAGVEAMVIRLAPGGEFADLAPDTELENLWRAGAAASLQALVMATAKGGCAGLEALAGIPGSVGGAVRMNSGAGGEDIGRFVVEAQAIDFTGVPHRLSSDDLGFSYRRSALRDVVVTGVVLQFRDRESPDELVTRARERRERKRASQPLGMPSAGCVFKNPVGDSAGSLLDQAGCKGMREGGAEVSGVHANFIVNCGGATARDVAVLATRMREKVCESTGIALQPEIATWGDEPAFAELRGMVEGKGCDVDK